LKSAVFDIGHAGCFSCKIAIENAGKNIDGIKEIQVDITTHRINLMYDNSKINALNELKKLVRKIGYEAKLVESRDLNNLELGVKKYEGRTFYKDSR